MHEFLDRELKGSTKMKIQIRNFRGLAAQAPAFHRGLWHVAQLVGTDVNNVAAPVGFETGGSWSPSIPNRAGSGAVGELQFMPDTCRSLLGWGRPASPRTQNDRDIAARASDRFKNMGQVEQLDYVAKYFLWFGKGKLQTLEDAYMSVLWPAGIGKPNDYVLFPLGTIAYKQNAGFDKDGNGVTKGEVSAALRKFYDDAQGFIDVEVDDADVPHVTPPVEDPSHDLSPDEVMARVALHIWDETGEAMAQDRRDAFVEAFDASTAVDRRSIPADPSDLAAMNRTTIPAPDDEAPPTPRNA